MQCKTIKSRIKGVHPMKNMKKIFVTTILAASLLTTVTPVWVNGNHGVHASQKAQVSVRIMDVIAYAKTLQGTPYKQNGATKKGFDASGFVHHVFEQYGLKIPRTSKEMYRTGQKTNSLQPGDLVFYDTKNRSKREVSYVGLYLGNHKFISVSVKNGISLQNMNNSYWKSKFMGAAKVKKSSTALKGKVFKVGEKVNGFTVSSVAKGNDEDGMQRYVTFKEPVTVTGYYRIIKTNAAVVHFFVNKNEVKKLPVSITSKTGQQIINFRDQEKVHPVFKGIKDGTQMKVTLKNYQVGILGKDAWIENADIVKIYRK
jgi:hypothetical protein